MNFDTEQGATGLSVQKSLEMWFQSALGRDLLAHQRLVIEAQISRLFGVHQLELGVSHRIPVGNPSGLGHKCFVLSEAEPDMPENVIITHSDEIAVQHEAADLVILHHTLDFCTNPHQTLREAARCLKASGHLLVVGFNPKSLWGLRHAIQRRKSGAWNCRYISGRRVEDWLQLLNFRLDTTQYHFYKMPFNRQGGTQSMSWLDKVLNPTVPLGAYYVMFAQKQVGAYLKTPKAWRKKAKVIGLPVANRQTHPDDVT